MSWRRTSTPSDCHSSCPTPSQPPNLTYFWCSGLYKGSNQCLPVENIVLLFSGWTCLLEREPLLKTGSTCHIRVSHTINWHSSFLLAWNWILKWNYVLKCMERRPRSWNNVAIGSIRKCCSLYVHEPLLTTQLSANNPHQTITSKSCCWVSSCWQKQGK